MEQKKIIGTVIGVIAFIALIAGATFAWWTWTSNAADKTNVTFQVPSGSNQLKAILDADNTAFSGMYFAENCNGTYAKKVTIQLYYQNTSGFDAVIDATLKLQSISSTHTGEIDTSAIKYALTSETGALCTSSVISEGTLDNIIAGNTDEAIIYNGNLDTGIIPTNTNMGLKKTLYLYFWLDSEYDLVTTGSATVSDPLEDLSLKVVWSGTITTVPHESYTVTYDLNGGQLPNGVPTSKTVINGMPYGELPTPTREGYTFKGWHGVQLLENTDTLEGYRFNGTLDTTATLNGSYSVRTYYAWHGIYIDLKQLYDEGKIKIGDTVSLSIYYMMNFIPTRDFDMTLFRAANSSSSGAKMINRTTVLPNTWYRVDFPITITDYSITSTNARIETGYYVNDDQYYFGNNRQNFIWFARPQVQLGSTATGYEPYYITSDTTVVQEKDHTLKAIWKPNTYTVTFDPNGGTVDTSTKTVTYGQSYGTLPTPTRPGYTFLGWNGKNMFSLTQNSNVTNRLSPNTTVNITNESVEISCSDNVDWRCFGKYFNLKSGTYTIRFKTSSSDNSFTPVATIYENGSINIVNAIYSNYFRTFTLQGDKTLELRMFCTLNSNNAPRTVKFYNLQIEEGTEATPYEPYYVTSDVTVTQEKNHTLTAIWEPSS